MCSLVESAKENGLIPRCYLNHLLEELPLKEETGEYELPTDALASERTEIM
ncbi:transposase domain-containing protein [[Clostridium] innocuum]|uniref:transposase domain-containing protein n=1 Tax=Clostridium innocuum TaxID=1522 RepID=UPI00325F279C|nr:transposase domain-containing protein [[Clostridium] innocuum]